MATFLAKSEMQRVFRILRNEIIICKKSVSTTKYTH